MKLQKVVLATMLWSCSLLAQDKPKPSVPSAETTIRKIYDDWAKAFHAKDLNAIMAFYAPGADVIAYDVVPPLQYKGHDAYKKDYAEFMVQFTSPIDVEFHDLHIYASGDVAFIHCLERISGTMKNGQKVDFWLRATSGLRNFNGKWLIVHDHISVPADFDTGKAQMDLKPTP